MAQPVDERDGLYRLAQTHLIGENDVCAPTPVVCKKIYSLQLEGPQLSELYVVGLLVQLDELATSSEV